MPDHLPDAHGFYLRRTHDGARCCRLCFADHGRHEADCPLVALRVQVQELGAQLGLYVATMGELLETVDALLDGDKGRL